MTNQLYHIKTLLHIKGKDQVFNNKWAFFQLFLPRILPKKTLARNRKCYNFRRFFHNISISFKSNRLLRIYFI